MKVLYILHSTSSTGGATKSFVRLLTELLRKGIEAWVVVPSKTGIYHELKKMPVHIVILPIRSSVYPDTRNLAYTIALPLRLLYWKLLNVYSFIQLKQLLIRERINIVHSNVSIIGVGYQAAKAVSIPHVYHIREYGDKDFNIHYFPTKSLYMQRMYEKNSYSICITKDIRKHHQLDTCTNSQVIYNGIASEKEIETKYDKELYFLFAGRIEKAKGVLELVKSYKEYSIRARKTLPLKIAGKINDAKYYQTIRNFIECNQLEDKIEHLGIRNDIYALMASATAIIIPSPLEGFGRCMAEAMFNDCLVIGRNTGGTKEQFDNGLAITGEEIGLRYEGNDELANLLLEVGENTPESFNEYRGRARQTVLKLYTIEKSAEQVACLYHKIADYE